MNTLDRALNGLRAFDDASRHPNALHDFDPRALTLCVLGFATVVVSYDAQTLAAMTPLAVFPLALGRLSGVSTGFLLARVASALPFAALVGAANLWLDTRTALYLGPYAVTGGMVSFSSILLRFALTTWAALALAAGLGMDRVCAGLYGLHAPRAFVAQLGLLYRFAFVLAEEGSRMNRARQLRSFGGKGLGMRVYAALLGQLLLRSLGRARRVHQAMLCRGFTGRVPLPCATRWRARDTLLVGGVAAGLCLARTYDLSRLVGQLALGSFR